MISLLELQVSPLPPPPPSPLPSPPLPQLAQTVVDAGAIAHLAGLVGSPDPRLKRQVFSALSQIAKHSLDLAEMVVEAEVFPAVLTSLKGGRGCRTVAHVPFASVLVPQLPCGMAVYMCKMI